MVFSLRPYILELTEKKQSVARQEQIKCNLSYEELNSLLTVTDINVKELERRLQRLINISKLRSMEQSANNAINHIANQYPKDSPIPDKMIYELSSEITRVLTPYLKR